MSNSTNSTESFNPLTQTFTIYMADGVTPITVSIADLDAFVLENSEVCVNYATQIGASVIMLLVVLLVTKESKRRSPIFLLNVLSLVLSFLRSLLQTLYWVGSFQESYSYFAGDYSYIPASAQANSVASLVLTLLFLTTVEMSLILQTNVVCTTMAKKYRWAVIALSAAISLLTIGFRFAVTVQNAEAIVSFENTYFLHWLASAALIMETISIWFFCLIFVAKLGYTLYQRRVMGLKQWGPMQIITIMGGCTMIVPSIFAILEYFPNSTFPEAGSLALTLVAIFLPLSSIWAAAAIDGKSPMLVPDTARKNSAYTGNHTALTSTHGAERKGSGLGPMLSPKTNVTTVEHMPEGVDDDLEAQGLGGRSGVRVDRTFSVK